MNTKHWLLFLIKVGDLIIRTEGRVIQQGRICRKSFYKRLIDFTGSVDKVVIYLIFVLLLMFVLNREVPFLSYKNMPFS